MIPAEQIEQARSRTDIYGGALELVRKGREFAACCPYHNEKTPSFYIYPDGHFHCFGCGAHGTAIDFVMRTRNLDFAAAVRWLLDMPEIAPRVTSSRPRGKNDVSHHADDNERVRAILRQSKPITERTAAALYLWSRGLSTNQPALLSHDALYCREIGKPLPALVAPITDSRGQVTAIQRIWTLGGFDAGAAQDARAPLHTRKKTLGPMRDGAVRLAPAGAVLGLAEGPESAIAASMVFRVPVWAVCGAARLGTVWIPPSVQRLMIFGDNGRAGRDLARKAIEAWRERGVEAMPVFPDVMFSDFADQLIGKVAA